VGRFCKWTATSYAQKSCIRDEPGVLSRWNRSRSMLRPSIGGTLESFGQMVAIDAAPISRLLTATGLPLQRNTGWLKQHGRARSKHGEDVATKFLGLEE
jgi:hypothetical protein